MSPLVEYLIKTSDQSFKELPFNEVDGLVLAYAASFLHYTNVKKQGRVTFSELKDAQGMRQFSSQPKHPDNRLLLQSLSQSKRYGEVAMIYPLEVIKPKDKVKFRAVTYELPNAHRVATFKGSDSSLLSWEENCRMLLKKPLPAVLSAVDYLKETMAQADNAYSIVGYSKGGHLAEAASLLLPEVVSNYVLAVYNYDGPGVAHIEELEELAEAAPFARYKFIPQESIFGALFEQGKNYHVIESVASGLNQHNPHTWKIEDNQLARVSEISMKSAWLSRLADHLIDASEETKAMGTIDACFALLKENDIMSIRDLNQLNVQTLRRMYRQRQVLADENRGYAFLEVIKLLIMILKKEWRRAFASKQAQKRKQIKQIKSRLVKEIEKLPFYGTEPLK